jgi:hypothetical protein
LVAQGPGIVAAGGKIVEILSSYALGQATTVAHLDAWITTPNLNVTAMIDGPDTPMAALTAAGIRETAWIVEMPSMKIVWMSHGDVTGQRPPTIVEAATEMHNLLGK